MDNQNENQLPKTKTENGVKIAPIVHEMQTSYLDYAMSVIISRALPDVRDGLKPVHRRIIYAMKENGFEYGKPFRKSARVVGDVMGKYHPHGDAAIYESMVRMSQDFSMRVRMVDGQGNFGSMDGDKAAAMRYTEARMSKAAAYMVEDLEKDTVDWRPNYDESTKEPEVLPARFPNLLVNGSSGIAVGMATNIPTHNLGEIIDACCATIDNPEITIEDLIQHVPAPDFPTGGMILGLSGSYSAYTTGRGSVIIRAKTHFEEVRTKTAIIVEEIPYQVNKKVMIEKIAELVKDKRIEGISDIRDESSRKEVRVVIELKRDAVPDVILNQLYKYSQLQTSFGVNMLAISKGRPGLMNLKQIIDAFLEFREEVIRRRTVFDLTKARNKAHILVGLSITVANLDDVIALIRNSKDPIEAKDQLMARSWKATDMQPLIDLINDPESNIVNGTYKLSEIQAKAILELKLHRLTGLEQEKLSDEIKQTGLIIQDLLSILEDKARLSNIMKEELLEVKEKFATPRMTEIIPSEFETDMEDLIAREDMAITITNTGYIKRVPLNIYKAQNRGGKGRTSMNTKEEDFVTDVFVVNTHTPVIFFSNKGIAYQMKVYRLPLGTPQSVGKALINLLPLNQGETISTIMPLPENEAEWENLYVMFATTKGTVRRNKLSDFLNIRQNGKIAMKFEDENDELIAVKPCAEDQDVFLTLRGGKCIRFPVPEVRVFQSRNSTGIRGIKVAKEDTLISMSIINHTDTDSDTRAAYLKQSKALRRVEGEELEGEEVLETTKTLTEEEFNSLSEKEQFILTVTETGFGKRTSSYEYRITHRGGSGIGNIKISSKTKAVSASFPILDTDNLLIVTDGGKMIRLGVNKIRVAGRQTMGVTLLKTAENEKVVSTAIIAESDEEDEIEITAQDNSQPETSNAVASTNTETTTQATTTVPQEEVTTSETTKEEQTDLLK